jgi:hypothetical protein
VTSSRFWIPIAVLLGLTPVMLFLGEVSASAGHGDYFLAKLLFPYTMLSTVRFGSIKQSFMVLAFIQYPLYGLILGIANLKHKLVVVTVALAVIHVLLAIAAVALVGGYFS